LVENGIGKKCKDQKAGNWSHAPELRILENNSPAAIPCLAIALQRRNMSTPMDVDLPAPAAVSSKAAASTKDKPRFEVKKAFIP